MLEKLLRGGNIQAPPEVPLVFSLGTSKKLWVDQSSNPVADWRFLSHQIRRMPQDLRTHTQRVLLAHASMADKLPGALQDLFLALGSSGQQLRLHLFELVQDKLTPDDVAFFKGWIDNDLSLKEPSTTQWRSGSMLSTGQEQTSTQLIHVDKSTVETPRYTNVLDEVIACIEYGQVDTARELLETEILAGNNDEMLEEELANIYQYTRDKGRLEAMMKHLQESGRAISATWEKMQQESEHW
jgi:hypothetical protein